MAISWQSLGDSDTTVEYGTSAAALDQRVTGSSASYYQTFSHTTVLSGLTPSTRYFYRVGDAASSQWSATFNFTTAKRAGDSTPFSIAVVGDMGRAEYNGRTTLALLTARAATYDFVFHVGDVGYADDAFLHGALTFGYEDAWDEYAQQIEPFAASMAYMVAAGNHEVECHSPACCTSSHRAQSLGNFSAYNARFRMPSAPSESAGAANMWYSFDHCLVHIVVIDTETDYPNAPAPHYNPLAGSVGGFGGGGDAQMRWLAADLAAVDRTLTPWLIVGGHRPVYSVDDASDSGVPTGDALYMQAAFESLFEEYHVDFYLCGHKHAYERSYPVFTNAVSSTSYDDPAHTVHLLSGAGGQDEGHDSYSPKPSVAWSAHVDSSHWGHGVLAIRSATEAVWTELDAASGDAIDTITVTKRAATTLKALPIERDFWRTASTEAVE